MTHTVVFDRVVNGYAVRFPYDALLVELLKSRVPSYARTWFSAGKYWTVDSAYAAPLAAAFTELGCTVVGVETRTPSATSSACDGWAQHLFRAVGPSRVTAVHRALSKVLHPDVPTGSGVLQRELNDARAELENVA